MNKMRVIKLSTKNKRTPKTDERAARSRVNFLLQEKGKTVGSAAVVIGKQLPSEKLLPLLNNSDLNRGEIVELYLNNEYSDFTHFRFFLDQLLQYAANAQAGSVYLSSTYTDPLALFYERYGLQHMQDLPERPLNINAELFKAPLKGKSDV